MYSMQVEYLTITKSLAMNTVYILAPINIPLSKNHGQTPSLEGLVQQTLALLANKQHETVIYPAQAPRTVLVTI